MGERKLKRIAKHSRKALRLSCAECGGRASIKVRLGRGGLLWLCTACIGPLARDLLDWKPTPTEPKP